MHAPDLWTRRAFLSSTVAAVLAPSVGRASGEQTLSNATLVMPDGSTQSGEFGGRMDGSPLLGPRFRAERTSADNGLSPALPMRGVVSGWSRLVWSRARTTRVHLRALHSLPAQSTGTTPV